MHTSNLLFLTL